jgi:hypothetical protein
VLLGPEFHQFKDVFAAVGVIALGQLSEVAVVL